MPSHPRPGELREFVVGSAETSASEEALMEHLAVCEDCYRAYENLWREQSQPRHELREVLAGAATFSRVESRLLQRIHVAEMGTAGSWLATEGFLRVVVGLLLPAVGYQRIRISPGRENDS